MDVINFSIFPSGNAKFMFEHLKLFDRYLKQRLHFLGLFMTDMYRYPEIPADEVSHILAVIFTSNRTTCKAVIGHPYDLAQIIT